MKNVHGHTCTAAAARVYLGELQGMVAAFVAVDGVEELVRGGLERAERRRRRRQGGVGPGGVAHDRRRQQRLIDRSISGAGKCLRVLRPIPPRVCVSLPPTPTATVEEDISTQGEGGAVLR